MVDDDGHLENR